MKSCSIFFSLLVGVFCVDCQPKNQTTTLSNLPEKLPIALLNQTRYIADIPIVIHFAEPVIQANTLWDGKASREVLTAPIDSLSIPSQHGKPGFHQLIVSGVTARKKPFTDTLIVELLASTVPIERSYTILATYPHDVTSFTEGLVFYKGNLYESTGQNGASRLMKIDAGLGKIQKALSLPSQYFGEGVTIVRDKIYQLTWKSGVCFRYNLDFTPDRNFSYFTQGWGLTHHDTTLIMSDGSNKLYLFTPEFKQTGEVAVYDNKGAVANLNELEYVDGCVFANIFQTNRIAQIDLVSGTVVAYLTMDRLLPPSVDTNENVLNGIAYQPQEKAFYITGKNWPTLTKIRLTGMPRL